MSLAHLSVNNPIIKISSKFKLSMPLFLLGLWLIQGAYIIFIIGKILFKKHKGPPLPPTSQKEALLTEWRGPSASRLEGDYFCFIFEPSHEIRLQARTPIS